MNSHFELKNPHLNEDDILYHIGLKAKQDLSVFKDVKYVCMGGKPARMMKFAEQMYEMLDQPSNSILVPATNELCDISEGAGRYSMYKVGPVLSVSHGIGMASLSVVLNELFKLLHYAKSSKDVVFMRMGSSGGLGVEPGTLVITEQPYNSMLEKEFVHVSIGKPLRLPCTTCPETREELMKCGRKLGVPVLVGNTIATDDFFEGQCRLDGAFCDYNNEDKMEFIKKAHDEYGVKNFEMESSCFSAMCSRANLKSAVICATFLDRLHGDTISASKEEMDKWQQQLFDVVGEYIKTNTN